jgi:translation initiation factor 1 (eIF-1/SUI1)
MNPFDDDNEEKQDTKDSFINIWVETYGRKKITYITGWNIPETDLKEHLKCIKKKNGCNGTIKEISNESTNNVTTMQLQLQLQGDHIDYVRDYLITNGVERTNIHVKG